MFKILIVLVFVSNNSLAKSIGIGVAWEGKSGMAQRVYSSFLDGLGEKKNKFNFEEAIELKSIEELNEKITEFEKSKKAVLLFRSSSFKRVSKKAISIPTFLGAGNNPIALGATDSMTKPSRNATGVTYYIPLKNHFKIFKSIFSQMKRIALFTEDGHPGAEVEIKETEQECIRYELECDFYSFKTDKELFTKTKSLKLKYDFIVLGAEDLIIRNTKKIISLALNTPVLSYSAKPVKDGALIGFVASDDILGRKLAQSFLEHFEKNKSISEIPFKVDDKPQFQINATTAKKLKVVIPFVILNASKIVK
ncbi:ABC transporter substrate-binding protein [Halobacteriovorax sp. HLS]|uniref:ABC transporter substrate-binding protein n=1 Tax=Halobacteriovorax sp. HLS TaxID=2234000 RepID=UPI000FD888A1|nr:ABC transporter substrate binding protein [Halobacteriovorax sp. HLS]